MKRCSAGFGSKPEALAPSGEPVREPERDDSGAMTWAVGANEIQSDDEYDRLHDCECGGCCPPGCPDLDD